MAVFFFNLFGQEIPHNGTDRNASQIHNGFVYWRGSYVREWEEHYEDDWDNTESYYYTEYGACRCDQGQLILQGNATAYCPSGYTYNSSASSCETTSTPTYVCPDGNAQVNGVCGAGSSSTIYIHTDYLGSPVAETNTSGSLLNARMYYQPFGEQIGTKRDEVSYTGHKFDTDLGLSYMQARYYDPVIGRFYSNDPLGYRGVHSFNRYTYANNNPYKFIDPDGKDSVFIARPLSGTDSYQHAFVITTNVDSNGNHSLASRFSFGPVDQPGTDPLRNVTGSGDATDIADAGFANDVINSMNNGTPLPNSVFTSPINAPDAVTEAVGNAVIGNDDYETLPALQPGPGANSNSAAVLIGQMASSIAGNNFNLPAGSDLPGANDANNVQVNKAQLQRDLQNINPP
jgi:RHS repeat-associated protein